MLLVDPDFRGIHMFSSCQRAKWGRQHGHIYSHKRNVPMTVLTETSWHSAPHIHTIKLIHPQNRAVCSNCLLVILGLYQPLNCAQVWEQASWPCSPPSSLLHKGLTASSGPTSDVAQLHHRGSECQGHCKATWKSCLKSHRKARNVKLQTEEEDCWGGDRW